MNCPHCNTTTGVEIDMHSDGYAKDILECNSCGTVWTEEDRKVVILSKAA